MFDYNVCRWCRWFNKGKCTNDRIFSFEETEISFDKFWEDGVLSEAIKEGINTIKFNEFEQILFESKISKKAAKDLLKILYEEFEDITVNLVEQIDGSVSKALQNFDFSGDEMPGVKVIDPCEHSCKGFF